MRNDTKLLRDVGRTLATSHDLEFGRSCTLLGFLGLGFGRWVVVHCETLSAAPILMSDSLGSSVSSSSEKIVFL